MKKKLFLLGLAILALSLVFVGCGNPTDVYRQEFNTLPGVKNLKANVEHDGLVILTWDPVVNAAGYKIIRRDTVTGVNVVRNSNTSNNYYVDTVGYDNQLVDGRKYDYTVVSLSNYSSANSNASGTLVQNGESKVTTAEIKVPASFTPALAADDIEIIPVEGLVNDSILVKFPNKPNLNYAVTYIYGKNEDVVSEITSNVYSSYPDTVAWYDQYKSVSFPALGGENSIYVRAWHVSNTGNNPYYTEITEVTKVVTGTDVRVSLGGVSSFSANRSTSSPDKVNLSWSNLTGADTYSIYKAKTNDINVSRPYYQGGNIITGSSVVVSGDWTAVAALQQKDTGGNWFAVDTLTDYTGDYVYAIIAKGAAGKSRVSFSNVVGTGTITNTTNFTASVKDDTVQLKWDADVDKTYRLEYAEVKRNDGQAYEASASTNSELVSAYTAITVAAADFVQGKAVINVSPAPNKNYVYKLTAIQNGVESNPVFYYLNSEAFSTVATFNVNRSNDSKYSQNAAIDSLAVSVTYQGSTFQNRDYTIELYRKVATQYKETPYAKVGEVTLEAGTSAGVVYVDTVPDITLDYQYKAVPVGFVGNSTSNAFQQAYVRNANQNSFGYGSYYVAGIAATDPTLGNAALPVRALIVATGSLQIDRPVTTNDEYNNTGYSINGLTLTIEYTNSAATPVKKSADLTIARAADTTNADIAANGLSGGRTNYYYYIQLPTDVGPGPIDLVALPWDDTFASRTIYTVQP